MIAAPVCLVIGLATLAGGPEALHDPAQPIAADRFLIIPLRDSRPDGSRPGAGQLQAQGRRRHSDRRQAEHHLEQGRNPLWAGIDRA